MGYWLLAGGVVLAADVGKTRRASTSDQLAAYRWEVSNRPYGEHVAAVLQSGEPLLPQ